MIYKNFYCKNTSRQLLLLILLSSILLSIIVNEFIINDLLYYKSLSDQLTFDQISQFLELKDKWEWLVYLLIPVSLLVKFFIVAICLDIGVLLAGFQVSFKKLFRIAVLAESAFLLLQLVQVVVLFLKNIQTLEQIQYTIPLSLLSLVDVSRIPQYLVYPFQVISLFQILYIFLLAYGLKILLEKPMEKMISFVLSTYGTGLVIWMVLIVFLSIQYT